MLLRLQRDQKVEHRLTMQTKGMNDRPGANQLALHGYRLALR